MNHHHAASTMPRKPRLKQFSWVFAWIAVAVQAVTGVLCGLAIMSGDPGWSMVTALILVPVSVIGTIVIAAASIVLALIYRFRDSQPSKHWWIPLVISVVSMCAVPLVLTILIFSIQ